MTRDRSRIALVCVCLATVGLGVHLRCRGILDRSLEYDEIWTLEHYALSGSFAQIFTDVATPNNHPLHSYLAQQSLSLFGANARGLRMPALLAGLLLIPLAGWLAWRLSGDSAAAAIAAAFVAGSGPLIHYAQTARGYSPQCLWLVAAAALMVEASRTARATRHAMCLVGVVLVSLAAVLTLPTSLLFLPILALAHVAAPPPGSTRTRMATLGAYGALAVLVGLWLVAIWPALRAGQARFGTALGSASDFAAWARGLYGAVFDGTELAALGLFFLAWPSYRLRLVMGLLLGGPLLLLPISSAGPPRVYLPWLPFVAVAAGVGLARVANNAHERGGMHRIACLLPAIAVGIVAVRAPTTLAANTPTDWSLIHAQLEANSPTRIPRNAIVAYPASAGASLRFHLQERAIECHFARLAGSPAELVQVGSATSLSGSNLRDGNEVLVPLREEEIHERGVIDGIPVLHCWLTPLASVPSATFAASADPPILVAVIAPAHPSAALALQSRLIATTTPDPWLFANPFFVTRIRGREPGTWRLGIAYIGTRTRVTPEALARLENESEGGLRFYAIAR